MRTFVMLAKAKGSLDRKFYASIKIDGMRAIWLPETRGIEKGWCPGVVATGLWSRGGKPILAPAWWLDQLPKVRLDGELYCESFNKTMSICRSFDDKGWDGVKYNVFDIPNAFYAMGSCNDPDYFFSGNGDDQSDIDTVVKQLAALKTNCGVVKVLDQVLVGSEAEIMQLYNDAIAVGHEGLMLRSQYSSWEPKRSGNLLKMKPSLDSEGLVIGTTAGKGKYVGMIGALTVKWNQLVFDLSGMTDAQRQESWIGRTVTFQYDSLTPLGVPRFARFLRERL